VPPHASRSLVVVSNRLPFTLAQGSDGPRFERSPGGLVSALDPALAQRGGVWIGWPGTSTERDAPVPEFPTAGANVRYRGVELTSREVSLYYGAFSNRTLWPLFHYFTDRTQVDPPAWSVYDRVNERFGEAAAEESDDASLVWIHDYQLLRAPLYLRSRAPGRRIAFFLHIPFPAYDVFRILPWARQLMHGMLAADLVGFHIAHYAQHFLTSAERLLGCEIDRAKGEVQWDGRVVTVAAHPIGIDVDAIEALSSACQEVAPAPAADEPATVLGVDRLDYTKGVHERLLALERLFERHPEHRRHVVFTQVLVPSRGHVAEYRALKRQIDETVGRINGRFSEARWTPIRYLVRSLSTADLVALYRRADVALITPLRDGMNLVAKEYVAAQLEDDGVLILSEFAGAAQELQEALIVNPRDTGAVAEALHRALKMPAQERHARMASLRDRVRDMPVQRWASSFLTAAELAGARARTNTPSPSDQVLRQLAKWLTERSRLALFLDYDGTLTPIVRRPDLAVLSNDAREALRLAAQAPEVDVTVVSGRSLQDVRSLVGIPGLTYVGDHGFEIEGPGLSHRPDGLDAHLAAVRQAAEQLAALAVPGAIVERKGATVSFHVRETPEDERRDALRQAADTVKRMGLRVTHGKMVLEGRPPIAWGKGHAVLHVLTHRYGTDWPARVRALYLGDDTTDEDAFHSLHGMGRSIFVGPAPADGHSADLALPDPDEVVRFIRRVAARAFLDLH
jgi:trehalose 6-phosphate synthase/phosphatase